MNTPPTRSPCTHCSLALPLCLQYLTTLNAIYAVNPKLKTENATLLQ